MSNRLIGPATINTLPPQTIKACRSEGNPVSPLKQAVDAELAVLQRLSDAGIDIDRVTQQLEDEGLERFNIPFDGLLATLDAKRYAMLDG